MNNAARFTQCDNRQQEQKQRPRPHHLLVGVDLFEFLRHKTQMRDERVELNRQQIGVTIGNEENDTDIPLTR